MSIKRCKKSCFCWKRSFSFFNFEKNINDLKLSNKTKLVSQDIKYYIGKFNNGEKIINFLDPPYKDTAYLEIIKLIKEKIFNKINRWLFIVRKEQRKLR